MRFRVVGIPSQIAEQVRATLKSPQYGHPAHVEVATGYGPCRLCLRTFDENHENRILFNYNPFEGLDSYPSPGPIFIHEKPCEPFAAANEFPQLIRRLPLVFEAYGKGRHLLAQERLRGANAEESIEKLFQQPGVEYIHVRNEEAGCFIAQIDRVQVETSDPEFLNSVLTCLC